MTDKPRTRRGVTLVELLVVISIMLLMTAIAIPLLRPILERRPVREAARTVSDFLSGAQVRARETGRPAAVWIERFANHPQAAFTLYQAEVPLPYGGDTVSSTASISLQSNSNGWAYFNVSFPNGYNPSLVSPGDLLQLNYQGPWYSFVTTTVPALVSLNLSYGTSVPWLTSPSAAMPYKIYRQPMRSAARPIQLPNNTVIDLYASGTGTFNEFAPNASNGQQDVIIIFSANGGHRFGTRLRSCDQEL